MLTAGICGISTQEHKMQRHTLSATPPACSRAQKSCGTWGQGCAWIMAQHVIVVLWTSGLGNGGLHQEAHYGRGKESILVSPIQEKQFCLKAPTSKAAHSGTFTMMANSTRRHNLSSQKKVLSVLIWTHSCVWLLEQHFLFKHPPSVGEGPRQQQPREPL